MAGNAPVLGAATLLLTIPSIALFGLMILSFADGHGIGVLPAVTAVFSLLFTADCP